MSGLRVSRSIASTWSKEGKRRIERSGQFYGFQLSGQQDRLTVLYLIGVRSHSRHCCIGVDAAVRPAHNSRNMLHDISKEQHVQRWSFNTYHIW